MSTKRNPDRSSHGDAVATGNALGHRPVLVPFWLVLEGMAAMIRSTIPADNADVLREAERLWPHMDKWARRRIAREVEARQPMGESPGWRQLLDSGTGDHVPVARSRTYAAEGDERLDWPSFRSADQA